MLISQQFPSKYLGSPDLQGHAPVVIIARCVMEPVTQNDNKPILYFQGKEKGMVLNKTNGEMLQMLFGDETDSWTGQRIQLYTIDTEYQGRPVKGLRIRAAPVQQQAAQPPVAPPPPPQAPDGSPDLDDEIPF